MHHAFLYISLPLQSKTIDLDWQNNNSSRASRFFLHFFAVTAWLRRELNAYFQVLWSLTWTQRNDIDFLKFVSSSPWPFCCFYLMYASFRSVTDRNSKILAPTRKGNFLLTSMDREFYATDVNTKERPCFSFLEVRYTLLEFNSRKNCQHLTNWTRRNKCNEVRLHFVSDFFVALAVVVA